MLKRKAKSRPWNAVAIAASTDSHRLEARGVHFDASMDADHAIFGINGSMTSGSKGRVNHGQTVNQKEGQRADRELSDHPHR